MKMVYLFLGSIVAAAAVGGVRSMTSSPAAAPEPAPIAAAAKAGPAPMEAADEPSGDALAGEVLEVIEVPNYSYMRVGAKGSAGSWAAVPTASGVKVGDQVRVASPMKMTDFKSTALNRTFPEIFFGTLEGGNAPHGMTPPKGYANGADPHGGAASPHGGDHANAADPHAGFAGGADPHAQAGAAQPGPDPHGQAAGAASPVEVKPGPKAAGANGRTVAEVIGQRATLNGKTVRVRGTVVKVTAGVMGRTYLHLRDGSGDATAANNDLTVTTEATPQVGETIEIEGNVVVDRDIGSGYKFPTLVEDAKVLKPL